MYNRLRSENRFHGIVSFRTTPAAYLQTSRLRIALAVTGYRKREGGREGWKEGSSFRNECAQGETVWWIVRSRLEWFARVNQGVFKECARARQVDGINFLLYC